MTSLHSNEFSPVLGFPFFVSTNDIAAAKSSVQYFRFIQHSIRLIQRSYAGLLKTEKIHKAQHYLQHLHQIILDLTAHLDGVDQYTIPRLTSINQDSATLGHDMMKRLLEKIKDPSLEPVIKTYPQKLVIRESTGKIKTNQS